MSSEAMKSSIVLLATAVSFFHLPPEAEAGCPFQNPFWFVEKPIVVAVTDEMGETVPNKIRVMWGRMENFKCVDYFQVEYFQRQNPAGTLLRTARINRHRRSVEIEVLPCTEYFFKVIASEDWKGMREDFKMFSEVVGYKVDYTPRFVRPPVVKERRRGQDGVRDREAEREARRRAQEARRREYERRLAMGRNGGVDPYGQMPSDEDPLGTTAAPPEDFTIRITWRLVDVDYPNCLDYFVLDYYDTLYNETGFSRTIARPFRTPKFQLEVSSIVVPCELDYEFLIRVFGYNGQHTLSYWTPPSCIVTTTTTPATSTTVAISTTTETGATTTDLAEVVAELEEDNERLQAKIDGLKQEYEKIGFQVFYSFKESFFRGLEDFLARRKAEMGETEEESNGFANGGGGGGGNSTEQLFG